MTPNRGARRARGSRPRPNPIPPSGSGSTADSPHRAGVRRAKRPGSVWPIALEDDHPAAGVLLPGWLLGTIVKIVALYTRPGERVLLLAPPTGHGTHTIEPALPAAPAALAGSGSGLLSGLIEAARTAAGLGRTVHARTAELGGGSHPPDGGSPTGPQSGHRLASQQTGLTPTAHRPSPGEEGTTGVGPDRFHAVIALVAPPEADWVAGTPWSDVLTSDGTLAFITYGNHHRERLIELSSLLTHTAHRAGLTLLDRVAVLEVPIRRSALATPDPEDGPPPGTKADAVAARHTRVHSDLHLYTRRRSAAGPEPEEDC